MQHGKVGSCWGPCNAAPRRSAGSCPQHGKDPHRKALGSYGNRTVGFARQVKGRSGTGRG